MTEIGTWTTLDCPEGDEIAMEAYKWLKEKIADIGGRVRIVTNCHDFGMYPSYEIDKPSEFDFIGEDFEDEFSVDDSGLEEKYDEWVMKMNALEEEFSRKYHND